MTKSLTGIAAAAMLYFIAAPTPADAFAVRHAAGLQEDQTNVEQAWHRGRPHRRYYRYPYRYGYRAYPYPYAYGPYPYAYGAHPYYRRYHYGPRFGVRVGPFGFGAW